MIENGFYGGVGIEVGVTVPVGPVPAAPPLTMIWT